MCLPEGRKALKMFDKKYFKETILLISVLTIIVLNILKIGGETYGPLISGLTLLVILFTYIVSIFLSNNPKPPSKVIEQIITLTFKDKNGENANYHKEETYEITQDNITRLIERGIRSDGSIEDINTSTGSCKTSSAFKQDYIIHFRHPLKKGIHNRKFSFNTKNAFMENKEHWILKSHGIMPKGKARIKFHPEKPPFRIRAFQIFDRAEADITKFLNELEEDNHKVYELPFQKKFAGSRIHLEWEWKEVESTST